VIGRIAGTVIDDPEYGSDYCMDLGNSLVLEPKPPFRYVNHGCDPNCTLALRTQWSEETSLLVQNVYLQAITQIESGDQLTIDYAWPPSYAIRCQCGSVKCRGWIVDKRHVEMLQILQYQGGALSD
jgi:hypothetical protein